MRILIPFHHYEDSLEDNLQYTLTAMGHEVRTLGFVTHSSYWSLRRYGLRVLKERLLGERQSADERKILTIAREFKPDMILAGVHSSINSSVLDELGTICHGRRVLWWVDPPANSQRWGLLDPRWDFVYLKDRGAVEKLQLVRENVYLLHEAMNPSWHNRVATQKNNAIVVAGNYYGFRQAVILKLMKEGADFELYGPSPPVWADSKIKKNHRACYVTKQEKSRVFGEGMACLNTFSLAEGNSLNCRAFEIAGAGGLQVIEYRPAIEECFEPGKELLAFKTHEELVDCLGRARNYPDEMKLIRDAGMRRAHAEHTYRHRLEVILGNL